MRDQIRLIYFKTVHRQHVYNSTQPIILLVM